MQFSSKEIADRLQGSINGDAALVISGITDLKNASEKEVSFILSAKYAEAAGASRAKVIISDSLDALPGKTVIKVSNAKAAYAALIAIFYPEPPRTESISPKASVSPRAKIGRNVTLGDFSVIKDGCVIGDGAIIGDSSVIGENTSIGENAKIYPNVSVYGNCVIGRSVVVHSGAVIGSDGFAFVEDKGKIVKVPQIGNVVIGDACEIGANCTIDRAAFGSTVLGQGVKLDNLVQVAHNVVIGGGTMVAAQTGIAGSVKIGKYCIIGGQVGFADHVEIGDFVKMGSKTGVSKDLPSGGPVYSGVPAQPLMELRRKEAYLNKLEDLFKRVKAIEKEMGK